MLKTKNKPIYNYLFKYEGWRNFAKQLSGAATRLTTGATHADELFYLFARLVVPSLFEGKTMWTNFAKFGDPTPVKTKLLPMKWLPRNMTDPRVFVIDEEFSTTPLWHSETIRYLREVYQKYRKQGLE